MNSHTEPEWMSEKSTLFWGRGTTPGSEHTAFICAMPRRKTMVLKRTTWNGPHKLKWNTLLVDAPITVLLQKWYETYTSIFLMFLINVQVYQSTTMVKILQHVRLNRVHHLIGLHIKGTFNLTWSCMQLRQEQIKNANYLLWEYEYELAI